MTKSLFAAPFLIFALPAFTLAGCASSAAPQDYAAEDCKSLRALVQAQDGAASVRGIELVNDRGIEEIRSTSNSPWVGRTRTRDEDKLRDERVALREAYRRKGCTR